MEQPPAIREGEPAPPQSFTLHFIKSEADLLASICDVCLKATGVQSVDACQIWLGKLRDAMKVG